jgi:hypothetical protein
MSHTARTDVTFTRTQKVVATFVLPVLLLLAAAALGSLVGGSTAPAPAHAETPAPAIGACMVVCTATTGGGGNIGSPVNPGTGSGGAGGSVAR